MVIVPHQSGTLTNTATVLAQEIDPNPANNTTQMVAVVKPVAAIALIQTKGGLGEVALGQEVQFALMVTNIGPDTATAVVLKTTLAAGLSFESATISQGTVSHDADVIRVELGELAAGSNATVNVQVRADQLGVWTNAAVLTAAEFDPELTNNSLTEVIQVKADADLSLTLRAAPDPVLEQGLLTYSISLTNRGPHRATEVRLADVLSRGVDVELVQTSQGSVTNDQNVVRYELGDLPVGSNATVTVVVQANGSGLLTNSASASAEEIDLNPADNVAVVVVRVVPLADLAVRRESGAEEAWLGRELSVEWRVSNQGPSAATEVRLEDQLPLEWRFVSVETSQGSGTNDQGIVRCELGALAAGANALVRVTALPITVGLSTNTVTVSASSANGTSAAAISALRSGGIGELNRMRRARAMEAYPGGSGPVSSFLSKCAWPCRHFLGTQLAPSIPRGRGRMAASEPRRRPRGLPTRGDGSPVAASRAKSPDQLVGLCSLSTRPGLSRRTPELDARSRARLLS